MAVENKGLRAEEGANESSARRSPAWLVPAYVGGLVLLYLGQRVVVEEGGLRVLLTWAGLALMTGTTLMRFLPQFRSGGQRASIEGVLGMASLAGLVGIGVYFASTQAGLEVLGLSEPGAAAESDAANLLTVIWVVLVLCSGLALVFGEAALWPMRSARQIEARRVKSAAAAGLTLGLALSYCALFVYAAGQTEAQADYSYFKTSEPGSSTRRMIESFDEPLKITAFFPDVSDARREVVGYFRELTDGVGDVEFSVVDRYLEPKLAQELKVFSDGTVVFSKGETNRTMTIGSELRAARAKLKTLDRDVQEQLYKLLRSRRVAYLTAGHGELNSPAPGDKVKGRTADLLQTLLRKQNYQVQTLGLAQGLGREVPSDAAVVMVLGPTQAFSREELDSLDRYAKKGGALFMALDAGTVDAGPVAPASAPDGPQGSPGPGEQASLEGLSALATIAGLTYSPAVLAHTSHHVRSRSNDSDRALLISNRFSSHASVSTLSRNASRAALLFAQAGSLASAGGADFKVDMAVRAMGGTFADLDRDYHFDEKTEKKDTYTLVAAVTKPLQKQNPHAPDPPATEGEAGKEMRAFVVADADAVSDLVLSSFPPNRLLVMDAVRWLGGEDSFVGEVNNEEDVRIEHTKQKDLVWFYSTILGAPLLVLGAGLSLSRRARRMSKEAT